MKLHNIIFAKVNDRWKATWVDGDCIGSRNIRWYEWPYFWFITIRNLFHG
jgi:hypothetical protein